MLCYLLKIVGKQIHKKFRGCHYELGMTTAQARRLIADVALTIDVHPANLGIEPETEGKVYVAEDVRIRLWTAENLFQFAEATREYRDSKNRVTDEGIEKFGQRMTIRRVENIPPRIMKIKPVKPTAVRAVIVVEHRNIAYALDWFRHNLQGCMIVMVTSSLLLVG